MVEFRFGLDKTIYADEIAAIRKLAGKKSPSKVMPKIITQWYIWQLTKNSQESVTSTSETWQNEDENDLADSLSAKLSALTFE